MAAGLDALVHFSCRDLNRNAMEARAMALARSGVRDLLVLTGDYTESGYKGKAPAVFDLDSVQAIRYLKEMSEGLEVPGRKKGTTERLSPTDFHLGAAVSPFKLTEAELMAQFFKMEKKIAAGADFIITQLGYDMRKFYEVKRYLTSRGLTTPLIGNVYVLSYGAARTMNAGGVPGCVVTDELLKVLEKEKDDPDKGKGRRMERAAKMVAMFRGMGFHGVHIGGFGLKPADFQAILIRAEELQDQWESFIPEVNFAQENEFYAFPEPDSYAEGVPDPDPMPALNQGSKSAVYEFMLLMHWLLFREGSLSFRTMRSLYKAIGDKGVIARTSHFCEYVAKLHLFACRDCGDCALPDTAYYCPMSRCAKSQRNGPCGGSVRGMCEVYPDEKRCAWSVIYDRLKSHSDLDQMRSAYVPPRKGELAYTSGWANYYLGRDHTARE
jgi:methylenetetrahydrofolate reductase (NADPH)